ncbi:MAG TPA: hypothetical protein PKI11_18080 [Candidatus Hydrogenedentes bacterium]|nr:hypothetical protein [Candidatus Hydrogenedentota bacterium]HNT87905.1 hypothetical protein [Candidatus Hydrogenedentota bacterium]
MGKRSDYKMKIREEARQKIRGPGALGGQKAYRQAVAHGHSVLLQKASEGGDSKIKRLRGEILFLLNNYVPSYDVRIEALIEEWRKSGDPEYDPAVKARLRKARKDHMRGSSAI